MMKIVIAVLICAVCAVCVEVVLANEPSELRIVIEPQGSSEAAPHGDGNVYAPDVLKDGVLYRMWYGGQGKDGHDRISYAESSDGIKWTHGAVMLKDDRVNHLNDPSVVKVNGTYFMYHTRTEVDVVDRIDLAVSGDGTTWQVRGAVVAPGKDHAWDSLSVGRPSVIHDGGQFRMWYDGRKDFPLGAPVKGVPMSANSHRSVGYATSIDGIHWTKYETNPVFEFDAGAVDVKRVSDNRLILLYESHEGTKYAISEDGIAWTDRGFLVKKTSTPLDRHGHVTPFLFIDPEQKQHRLFVGAARAATWDHNQIGEFVIDPVFISNRIR